MVFTYSVKSQIYEQYQIDSLLQIVNNPVVKDADRIDPLARLSRLYISLNDTVSAEKYITQARTFAKKEKDSKYKIYVYNQQLVSCLEGYPKKIRNAYLTIDSIYTAIAGTADLEAQALGYDHIGNAKWRTDSEYDLDDFYKSLSIAEKLPEKSTEKYKILYDIYLTFFEIYEYKNRELAEKYIPLMRQTAKESKDKNNICQYLARKLEFSSTYLQKDTITQNVIELNSFILKNIKYLSPFTYTLAVFSFTAAFDNLQDNKQKQLIADYIENLKTIAETNIKNQRYLNKIKFLCAYTQKNYAEAIDLALQIIKNGENEHPATLYADYNNLAEVYMLTKQYEKAANTYKNCLAAYQRHANVKTEEQRQLNEVKFGVLKQQQEIRQQKRRILYITAIAIFVIFVLSAIVLLLNRQNKVNNLKRKNAELMEKQAVAEKEKAKLVAEKAALEKEKMGERLMTNVAELERKNQLLDNVKNMDNRQLNRTIRKEQKNSKITMDYVQLFQEIRPEFYVWLEQQAAPKKLTKTELKCCAYMSLKMSNKELANVMNVSHRTIDVHKYNIRKKFHLSANESLEDLIVKFTPPY